MPPARKPAPPRLIDLHIDWLAQYAPEIDLLGPQARVRAARDLPRIDGYLGTTTAAVLVLRRDAEDWSRRGDPWVALGELIARCEAEFSGRLLIGPEDLTRWRDDPDSLTWGVLAIGGLESLVRSADDLPKLAAVFERGVRMFQLIGRAGAEERGLSDLERSALETLSNLGRETIGPKPSLDIAGMGAAAVAEVLDWFEADADRARRLIPVRTCGPMPSAEVIRRIRALGGLIGVAASSSSFESSDAMRIAIEEAGTDGIALATDAFGQGTALRGVEEVEQLRDWAWSNFGAEGGATLIRGNAERWIERLVGAHPG